MNKFIAIVFELLNQMLLSCYYIFLISLAALLWADFIFCFKRMLSSSKSFKLCSLSAKSIDKESFSVNNRYKILPHYTPHIHLSLSCLFSCLITAIL